MDAPKEFPPANDESSSQRILERLRAHKSPESRYRIDVEIGRGGMGEVFKVWDADLRRVLAMKIVLASGEGSASRAVDDTVLGRFLEEAQVTGQLDHPGIVPVHELGLAEDGRVFFTMRMVKGQELKAIFELVREEKEGWNQTRALGVLLKVCEAMSYAHSKGVIHRDLKPANVMVGKFGEVYVMDWGLARVMDREDRHDVRITPGPATTYGAVRTERKDQREVEPDSPLITMDGDIVGTPAYMPPEQAKGQLGRIGPHSDVYALGAMLYHLLAGEMPYVPRDARVSQHSVLMRVIEGPPRPLAELAPAARPELLAICEKAMERDIESRYRDMGELADELRAFVEGGVVRAYQSSPGRRLRSYWRRQAAPIRVGMFTGYVVLPILAAGGFAFQHYLARMPSGTVTSYVFTCIGLVTLSVALVFGGLFVPKKPKVLGICALLLPAAVFLVGYLAVKFADRNSIEALPPRWSTLAEEDVKAGRFAEALAAMRAVPVEGRRPTEQVALARSLRDAGRVDLALEAMDEQWDRDASLGEEVGFDIRAFLRKNARFGEWRALLLLENQQPERARETLSAALQD